jgi:hypothetical protein
MNQPPMAAEMIGHRLVPLEQNKDLGGALCGWHRASPPEYAESPQRMASGVWTVNRPPGRGVSQREVPRPFASDVTVVYGAA